MRKIFVPLFDDLMQAIERQRADTDARTLGMLVPYQQEYDCFRLQRDDPAAVVDRELTLAIVER